MEAIDATAGQDPSSGVRKSEQDQADAADEKLFIVTAEGKILAFAAGPAGEPTELAAGSLGLRPIRGLNGPRRFLKPRAFATATLSLWDEQRPSGRGASAAVVPAAHRPGRRDMPAGQVAALRQRLYLAGLYGTRREAFWSATHRPIRSRRTWPASSFPKGPMNGNARWRKPYSTPCVRTAAWPVFAARGWIVAVSNRSPKAQGSVGPTFGQAGDYLLLARPGPLPGAADWSHAEANAAGTGASDDDFIRSPMSVLWFDAAQRWHKYPGQNLVRVAGGRLVLYEKGLNACVGRIHGPRALGG